MEKMSDMENKKDIYAALLKAWCEFPTIVKNAKGRFDYENLPGVYDLIIPVLKENKLGIESKTTYDFNPITGERFTVLEMRIFHTISGAALDWSRYPLSELPLSFYVENISKNNDSKHKENPVNTKNQADGGSQTFHRRYQIKLIFNICGEYDDNDGDSVGKKAYENRQSYATPSNHSSPSKSGCITENSARWIKGELSRRGLIEDEVLLACGVESFEDMTWDILSKLKKSLGIEDKPRPT